MHRSHSRSCGRMRPVYTSVALWDTHNCCICNGKSSAFQKILLMKINQYCGFTVTFFVGLLFFEEAAHNGLVTCTLASSRYKMTFETFVARHSGQRQWLDSFTFMQDAVSPHIGLCVLQFLLQIFSNHRIISRPFSTTWPPCSPDFNPRDF